MGLELDLDPHKIEIKVLCCGGILVIEGFDRGDRKGGNLKNGRCAAGFTSLGGVLVIIGRECANFEKSKSQIFGIDK